MLTESTEMYLLTVYRLTRNAPHTSTSDIAASLGVSLPSVSEKVKRLTEQDYLFHEWRQGVSLTPKGQKIALNMIRKHRLVETFLVRIAGYHIDEVHAEACQLEHAISDRLADRLEALLDYPRVDPHGHPIPARDGTVDPHDYPPLAEVNPGQPVVIRRVSDVDSEQLRYLRQVGLVPGTRVVVQERAPFDGPLTLRVDGRMVAIAPTLAREIGIETETRG